MGGTVKEMYYIVYVLFLVKCYDNKMVKSPGCLSVEATLWLTNNKKNVNIKLSRLIYHFKTGPFKN